MFGMHVASRYRKGHSSSAWVIREIQNRFRETAATASVPELAHMLHDPTPLCLMQLRAPEVRPYGFNHLIRILDEPHSARLSNGLEMRPTVIHVLD